MRLQNSLSCRFMIGLVLLSSGVVYPQDPQDGTFERSYGPVLDDTLELTGSLPGKYWANGMLPGEVRVMDGVIHRAMPAPEDEFTELDDASREALGMPPKEITAIVSGDSQADADKRRAQRIQYAEWIIDKEFGDLPAERKNGVGTTILDVVGRAMEIEDSVQIEELSEERVKTIRKQYADLLAVLLITQREAYRGLPEIQQGKLGEIVDYSLEFPSREDLAEKVLNFMDGSYLESGIADAETTEQPQASLGHRRETLRREAIERAAHPPKLNLGESLRTVTLKEEPAQPVAVEGRIFVAESALADGVWPLTDLVHTNIIAGYWILEREKTIVEQYRVSPPPNALETAAAATQRRLGTLVSRKRYTMLNWNFHKWMWANGNAGNYTSDDELRLVERIEATNDWGKANRALFSYTGKNGQYCRNRATSYSLGFYGLNWVCHQNANAFMKHRRGYEPVDHWYSNLLFGSHGNYFLSGGGISTCATIITDSAMKGCIPGNWCQGNHYPYVWVSLRSLLFEAAPGHGWGLADVWHRGRQEWIGSQARYSSAKVSFLGKDDKAKIVVEDLLVVGAGAGTEGNMGVVCPNSRPNCCEPYPNDRCRAASACISVTQSCP